MTTGRRGDILADEFGRTADPRIWAMCAIDALGLPAMAGRGGRITSAGPADGTPIEVTVRDRHPAHWPGVTGGMQGGRQFLGGRYDGGAR